MQALVVATTDQRTTGVLVDDEDLAVHVHVVAVELEELLGLDRVVQVRDQRGVRGLVEVVDAEAVLDLVDAGLEDRDGALLLVDLVVDVLLQPVHHARERRVPALAVLGRAGDDQRGARLVDEDRVDLVHDGEVVLALDAVLEAQRHVVAQVVEAELVVRAVGDVGGVRHAALGRRHLRQDRADVHAEEVVDAAHLLRLELGQVVVHRHHVHAAAGDRVQVRRQGRDERLALTGLHLGDVAEVQRRAAHELDVEVPLAEDALAGLADRGERLGQQRLERLAVRVPLLEVGGLALQLVVAHRDEVVLDGVDLVGHPLELLEDLALADTEQPVHQRHEIRAPY